MGTKILLNKEGSNEVNLDRLEERAEDSNKRIRGVEKLSVLGIAISLFNLALLIWLIGWIVCK